MSMKQDTEANLVRPKAFKSHFSYANPQLSTWLNNSLFFLLATYSQKAIKI
jgi:hypothetical protein